MRPRHLYFTIKILLVQIFVEIKKFISQRKYRTLNFIELVLQDNFYNVSPFPRDVGMSRIDVAMNPFIFLLKINGQKHSFYINLGN